MTDNEELGYCVNHPTVPAVVRCRNCDKPICQACAVRLNKQRSIRFCSALCRDQFIEYQDWRMKNAVDPFKKRFTIMAMIKHLGTIALLLFIIWLCLFFLTRQVRVAAQFGALYDLFRSMF